LVDRDSWEVAEATMVEESYQEEAYRRTVVAKPNGPQIELHSQYFEGMSDPPATKNRV
jgi:hypothetical protein